MECEVASGRIYSVGREGCEFGGVQAIPDWTLATVLRTDGVYGEELARSSRISCRVGDGMCLGAAGQLRSEIWGEGNRIVSAIGLSVDGNAEGDLGREFKLISSVGGHQW